MAQEKDLTQGGVFSSLMMFALPYIGANFIQALYGAADLIIAGRFCSAGVIAGIAAGSQLMQTLIFFITGLTVSGTVLIGKAFGAKKYDEIIKIINTMTICFSAAAIVLSIFMIMFDAPVLRLLQTPDAAFAPAREYIFICSLGLVFIFGFNALAAILRGLGNSKAPMYFIIIACAVNIILDLIFIGRYQMGAAGAALATVIAQAVSVIAGIIYMKKGNFVFKLQFRNIKFDIPAAKEIFKIGLPLSLQDTLTPLSFLVLFSLANSFGAAASAAYGSVVRLNAFMMLPAGSFAMALTAITAQNLGAGKMDRAFTALQLSAVSAFIFGIVFFLWQQISPESAIAIFTSDKEILKAGSSYLRSFSFDYLLVPFVFCCNGFFFGCGRTIFAAVNSIISAFLIRIPAAFLLCALIPNSGLFELGIAAPAASVLTSIVSFLYLYHLYKNNKFA